MDDVTNIKDDSKIVRNSKDDVNMTEIQKIIKYQILGSNESRSEALFNKFISFTGLVLLVIGTLVGYNVITNKEDFKRLETSTKEKLDEMIGKEKGKPNIVAYPKLNQEFEGSTIEAKYFKISDEYRLGFDMNIKNIGDKVSEPITIKLYFNAPIKTYNTIGTSDEKDFDDEFTITAYNGPIRIYPGVSFKTFIYFPIGTFKTEPDTMHKFLIKIWYGEKEPFHANFMAKITE